MWGWLPDKMETSYKVFFLLIEKKLKTIGLNLKVESVISDFEMKILKSVDEMLQCPILGCSSISKSAFKEELIEMGLNQDMKMMSISNPS